MDLMMKRRLAHKANRAKIELKVRNIGGVTDIRDVVAAGSDGTVLHRTLHASPTISRSPTA